jgi:hypothetical protein
MLLDQLINIRIWMVKYYHLSMLFSGVHNHTYYVYVRDILLRIFNIEIKVHNLLSNGQKNV